MRVRTGKFKESEMLMPSSAFGEGMHFEMCGRRGHRVTLHLIGEDGEPAEFGKKRTLNLRRLCALPVPLFPRALIREQRNQKPT